MIKNLHHVGIVVKDLDATMKTYGGMLGAGPVNLMENKEIKLRKADYKVGGSMLEFFEGSPGSMFGEWLAKNGEGIHHIAYEVEDIEGELKKQAGLGVTLIDKEPRVIPGAKIAFIGPEGASGVMIEMVEPTK